MKLKAGDGSGMASSEMSKVKNQPQRVCKAGICFSCYWLAKPLIFHIVG